MVNCAVYVPNERQVRCQEVARDCDYRMCVLDMCAAAEISPRVYYLWHENEGFRNWWMNKAERHFTLQLPSVAHATFAAATGQSETVKGSSVDRRTFFERFDKGFAPRSRQEIAGTVGLEVSQLPDAELERRAHALGVAEPMPAIEGRVIEPEAIPVALPSAEAMTDAESFPGDE